MKWPLRLQILLPAACLLIAAVCINAITAAVWASYRADQQLNQRLQQVGQVLADTSFPRSRQVLTQLQQLTAAEYAIWDVPRKELQASTFVGESQLELQSVLEGSRDRKSGTTQLPIKIGGINYIASRIDPSRTQGREELWLMVPEQVVSSERWSAAWPALITGGVSLLLLIPIVSQVAQRLGQRIATLQRQVTAVADGNYSLLLYEDDVDDEIHRLIDAVNEMTRRLRELEKRIANTERTRLLGQFAGGVAHQLRNGIAGARLAVQLHARRCPQVVSDDSLQVALKQLTLTEQSLKGLLALGRRTPINRVICCPVELQSQVAELIAPLVEHHGVDLQQHTFGAPKPMKIDREAIISALLNLLMNGLDAAGRGGQVRFDLFFDENDEQIRWQIQDSGPGPAPEIAAHLFEPFQTSKPEGVGLGLAQALQVANDHAGSLDWYRDGGWTVFRFVLPYLETDAPSSST